MLMTRLLEIIELNEILELFVYGKKWNRISESAVQNDSNNNNNETKKEKNDYLLGS